jgi:rhodanese-related sulfurtransferase
MYVSLREKLLVLPDEVIVYPTHGAGSLCGKSLKNALSSTMGEEKKSNWSLQTMTESDFIKELTTGQLFVPKYFSYDVHLNTIGAPVFAECVAAVKKHLRIERVADFEQLDPTILIVDTRSEDYYKNSFLPNSINLMLGGKFATWLGTIVAPHEKFYLLFEKTEDMKDTIEKIADIGYETNIEAAGIISYGKQVAADLDIDHFTDNLSDYTIIDVRNYSEIQNKKIFSDSIPIPLGELRNRISEIPTHKPIVLHCAAGYRSAAAFSIVQQYFPKTQVYDLGVHIARF